MADALQQPRAVLPPAHGDNGAAGERVITPLVRINALRLGCEFETSLTKRRGIILDRISDSAGIEVAFADVTDGSTQILHGEIKVRPLRFHGQDISGEESIH